MSSATPFRELTLVREDRHGAQTSQLYGERSGRDGDISKIPDEITICKAIGRVLYAEYPGHAWHVEVNAEQGFAKITIPALLGRTLNWGYVLHLDSDLSRKAVIEAGGHILERFNIPRSTVDFAAYAAAEQKIPLLGNFRASHRRIIPA